MTGLGCRGVYRVLASLSVVGALFFGAVFARASASEPGPAGAASATQDGWWNRLQGPVESEPAGNPVRPLLPAPPAPPTVPADAIVTSAVAGEVDKVAAVGLELALPEGVQLAALLLHLKESPAAGANVDSTQASVLACPATHGWGGHKNASWADRPQADCRLGQVQGVRAGDGAWTFDLTPLVALWADPFAALAQNGVVLSVDPNASPSLTQVSWLDFDSGNVAVEFLGTPAFSHAYMMTAPADGTSARASAEPLGPVPAGDAPPESGPPGAGDASRVVVDPLASQSGDSLSSPRPHDEVTSGSEAAPVPSPDRAALAAAPRFRPQSQAIRTRQAVGFWKGMLTPTALLIPVVLGLALLVGLALGPRGRPQPVWKRAGGLSRALNRRRGGGGDGI